MQFLHEGFALARLAVSILPVYLTHRRRDRLNDMHFMNEEQPMAAFATTRKAPLGAASTYRFFHFFDVISSAVAQWNEDRLTRKALEKLSDRELDDIGLSRGDIALIGVAKRV